MKNEFPLLRIITLAAVAVGLAGCASTPPSHFYTLNPLVTKEVKQSSAPAAIPVSVIIAPVEIPDYLERPQIVTRDGQNELKLAEYDRWAGSLSDSIAAVTAENLALLLQSDRVFVSPRVHGDKSDFSVEMRVLRLDCVPGDQVFLKMQWTVYAGQERKDIASRVSTCTEKLKDNQYATLAAAVSRTLEQVSREIGRVILDQPNGATANR
jgi:hypothetical protein